MEFLFYPAGETWVKTHADGDEEEGVARAQKNREILKTFLRELLLTENLVVLCGLGTSRSVLDPEGNTPALTLGDLWDAARENAADQFEEIVDCVHYEPPNDDDSIELLLSRCQLHQALNPNEPVGNFMEATERLIVELCDFLKGEHRLDTHEAFLRKVARRSTRQPRMKLFTTNYDLCFETAANRAGFVVVDGFSHSLPQTFDAVYFAYDLVRREQQGETPDYIPNVFQLHKLHGSVDWERRGSTVLRQRSPDHPVIIYPRHTKFESSYDPPFLEMMSRFQLSLRQPNVALLVIGFGLNDNHIVQPIMSAVRSNVGLKAAVVDPVLKDTENAAVSGLRGLIQNGDPRLALVAARFEELVPVLPDLVAASEEERHHERVRELGL